MRTPQASATFNIKSLSEALDTPEERERFHKLRAWQKQQTFFEEVISRATPPEGDFFINQAIQDGKAIQDGEMYAGKRKPPYPFGGGVD